MIEQYNPENNPNYNKKRFLSKGRFEFKRQTIDGKESIIKKGIIPETHENLEREFLWSEFMNEVSRRYPDAYIRSPEIYNFTQNELSLEFIDAPILSKPDALGTLNDVDFKRFVQTFEIFDSVGGDWKSQFYIDDSNEHTPYDQVDKSWKEWFRYTNLPGFVSKKMDSQARQLVNDYKKYITPRMQHGDYKPWHIFDKNGEWVVFDGEHSSETKPRYYDLAYMYARTFVLAKDSSSAEKLLKEFVSHHSETKEDFFNAFLPVLMSRSMGMFLDALLELKKGKIGYRTEAKELFDRCLMRDLSILTG